jgi:hypothetical protein
MTRAELFLEDEDLEELKDMREELEESGRGSGALGRLLDYIQMWKEEHDD